MRWSRGAVFAACLWVVCAVATAYGQQPWEKKPYQQWSLKESLKILTDSPWAQTEDLLKEGSFFGNSPQAQLKVQNDPFPSILATSVRLRSALTVRQAFVRQRQLGIKYDKLGAAERAKFDAEVAEFLECPPCAKYYIVTVDSAFLNSRNKTFPAEYSIDKLQSRAYLANDKGGWRECVHARRENQEILFFFRRADEQGRPLIGPDNAEFYFTMSGRVTGGGLKTAGYHAFKVAEITVGGAIVF